jgi:deoxyribonuclease-4
MFGSHLSIAGGMTNALDKAESLGLDCVQVFTKNQRQWKVKPLAEADRDAWLDRLKQLGWRKKTGPIRVVSHNSYLINMASPDPEIRKKSIALQRVELERCEELAIRVCVAHPGAHLGQPRKPGEPNNLEREPNKDERGGLDRIVKSLNQIHQDLPGLNAQTLLETTVGSGTNLGYAFHHLAYIRERLDDPDRVGYCFDTCHVTAAGYDMTTDDNAKAVLRLFDQVCGLRRLKAIHLNDSIGDVGSRKDRHAHIGDGACGEACFRTIVNRKALRNVPMILETPKDSADDGQEWDSINISRLKGLIDQ